MTGQAQRPALAVWMKMRGKTAFSGIGVVVLIKKNRESRLPQPCRNLFKQRIFVAAARYGVAANHPPGQARSAEIIHAAHPKYAFFTSSLFFSSSAVPSATTRPCAST